MRMITAPGRSLPVSPGHSNGSSTKVSSVSGDDMRAYAATAMQRAASLRALVPVAAVLVAALLWAGRTGMTAVAPRPMYSVAAIQARLDHSAGAWAGRTIRVRGIAIPKDCSGWDLSPDAPCLAWRQGIVNPVGVALLPITREAPHPLLALLRRADRTRLARLGGVHLGSAISVS
jgi:hypothetical protein